MPILVASVHDSLQALNRVVSLLRGRQFAIDTLTLARSEQPEMARLTLVVNDSQSKPERVASCLEKLEEVSIVHEAHPAESLCREMALVKLMDSPAVADWLAAHIASGPARLAERGQGSVILELCGTPDDVSRLMSSLPPASMVESSRVGPVVMRR